MYLLDTNVISELRKVKSGKADKNHIPDPRSDRDAIIAATAIVHGMTVVTRNVADFKPTGVEILNPWDD